MTEPTDNDHQSARTRRPWSRFRDLPIWSKLGVIMVVPTLATLVVGTNGLVNHIDTAGDAERARTLAELSSTSGELVHHLQEERAAAVMFLSAGDEEQQDERAGEYAELRETVQELQEQYHAQSAAVQDVPQTFRTLLADIEGQLSVLEQTRHQIGNELFGISEAAASYETLIGNLINLRDSSAQFAGDVDLANRMQAAAAVAQAKELLSQQRIVGHEVLDREVYHPHLRSSFIGARTGYEQALQSFGAVATDSEQAQLDRAMEGSDVRQSQLYQDYLDSLDGTQVEAPFDEEAWDAVMATHAELLRSLESELDEVIVAEASALRDSVIQQVFVETGLLLLMLLLAVLLAWLVARSMARSLRDLRHGALSVAESGLPRAVERLRDPTVAGHASPAEVAHEIAEPLPVRSRDEFGQVSEAFNAVHLEAVRTAAEQAQLRSSVATMFVNLARRSQIMVDRLISHLERLERGEEDPDRLGELFQLDHLATRMRRNDENLLVLAGADSTRVQREPATLIDVLRGAQSEVEHYTRIEFGIVERDLMVSAHAVNDLVHLVAELLDNATAFSPPDSPVMVEARRVGDRAVLYVEDHGLGMSAEQLEEVNERLANPPMVDVAVSRMMGLVVVGRLAARHGVRVQLRASSDRGTVADVTLPSSVLVSGEQRAGGRGTEESQGDWTGGAPHAGPFAGSPVPPSSPAPAGSRGPGPGGAGPAGPGPGEPGGPGEAPRDPQLPAWSDLTGVTGFSAADAGQPSANGADPRHASGREQAGQNGGLSSLPQRRPDPTAGGQPDQDTGRREESFHESRSPEDTFPGFRPQPPSAPEAQGWQEPQGRSDAQGRPDVQGSPDAQGWSGPQGWSGSGAETVHGPGAAPQDGPAVPRPRDAGPTSGTPQPQAGGHPEPPPWPPVAPTSSTPVPSEPPPPPPAPPALDATGQQQAPASYGEAPAPAAPSGHSEQPTQGGYPYNGPQPVGPPTTHPPAHPSSGHQQQPGQQAPGQQAPGQQAPSHQQPAPHAEQGTGQYPGQHRGQPAPQGQFGGAAAGEQSAWSPAAAQAAQAAAAASAQAAQAAAAAQEAARDTGSAPTGDETMELPIFRELESMWFRSRESGHRPGDQPTPSADTGTSETMELATIRTGTNRDGSTGPGADSGTPQHTSVGDAMKGDIVRGSEASTAGAEASPQQGWETAADEGWRAASQAAETPVEETTSAGLPKRQPMAQLVPGGVDQAPVSGERRSPEAVRGLLSAYHRGVQRGREQTTSPGPGAPGGSQSAQAGKEQST